MEKEEITANEEMNATDMQEVVAPENTETEMPTETEVEVEAETETPTTSEGKQKIMAYMSKRKGEAVEKLSDDELEELGEMLSTDVEALEKQDEIFRKLYETFDEFPEVAGFISDLVKTGNLRIAVARNFDSDALTVQEGDEDEMDYNSAIESRKKAKEQYDNYNKEMQGNMAESIRIVGEFVDAKKMDDERAENFMNEIDNLMADVAKGKLTTDVLEMFWKGFKYDEDITEAEETGKIAGRTEQIEPEIMETAEEVVPDLGTSGGGGKPAPAKKRSPFADIADNYRKEYKL